MKRSSWLWICLTLSLGSKSILAPVRPAGGRGTGASLACGSLRAALSGIGSFFCSVEPILSGPSIARVLRGALLQKRRSRRGPARGRPRATRIRSASPRCSARTHRDTQSPVYFAGRFSRNAAPGGARRVGGHAPPAFARLRLAARRARTEILNRPCTSRGASPETPLPAGPRAWAATRHPHSLGLASPLRAHAPRYSIARAL